MKLSSSIALAISIVLSLTFLDSPVLAQQGGKRFTFDTGVITLGQGQQLRVAIAGDFDNDGDVDGADYIRARFTELGYIEQGNVYKIISRTTSAPVILGNGEAAYFNVGPDVHGARGVITGVILGKNRNVRSTAEIIDISTGKVVSHIILGYRESDFN